jgi:hypothetical protein
MVASSNADAGSRAARNVNCVSKDSLTLGRIEKKPKTQSQCRASMGKSKRSELFFK